MQEAHAGQGARAGTVITENIISRLPLLFGSSLVAQLCRRDLGALRAACHDGRALVQDHLEELDLAYLDRYTLAECAGNEAAELVAEAAEAAQTSCWPALLARFPRCTTLTLRIALPEVKGSQRETYVRLTMVDVAAELLEPFAKARPETTARITALRLRLDVRGVPGLILRPSFPERLVRPFPGLSELRLVGNWNWTYLPQAYTFYESLARSLPRIQRLHVGAAAALDHIRLLPAGRMADLRELTLGPRTCSGCPSGGGGGATQPSISPAAAVALGGSMPQLRVLCLRSVPPGDGSLAKVLQAGLAPSLERLDVSNGADGGSPYGPYLSLRRPSPWGNCGGSSSPSHGGGAGGRGAAGPGSGDGGGRGTLWDVVLGSTCRKYSTTALAAAAEAVAAAGLPVRGLDVLQADVQLSRAPLLLLRQRCRQVVTELLCVCGDEEVAQLAEALRLLGPPGVLQLGGVEQAESWVQLEALAPELLAPRLRRLELSGCPGLSPSALLSLLSTLPRCSEVQLERCAGLSAEPQFRELVSELLALPPGDGQRSSLRGRRLRVRLGARSAGRGLQQMTGRALQPLTQYCTPEKEVGSVVSRVMLRVRARGLAGALNAALELGGVAARLDIHFGHWQGV